MAAAATATTTTATLNLSLTAFRTTLKSGHIAGSFRWFTSLLNTLEQLSPSPLLMFPPPPPPLADHKKSGNAFNRFYSPIDDKLIKVGWNSPEDTFDARCIGSCNTVLAYISRRDCSIFLFNPFTQTTLFLPPIETLPCVTSKSHNWFCTTFFSVQKCGPKGFNTDYIDSRTLSEHFINKLIISNSNPKLTSKDRTVWIIYGENRDIAFWRFGHDSWTILNSPFSGYNEFVHWKDQIFFTLIESRDIVECWDLSCKISSSPLRIEINAEVSPYGDTSDMVLKKQCKYKRYLVISNDEILMVVRYFYELGSEARYEKEKGDDGYGLFMTFSFDVYKLDLSQVRWESVRNIEENAIFLGTNHSFSCSTLEFDGLKKNSIYFTSDVVYEYGDSRTKRLRKKFSDDGHDFGVFDIEDGSIKSCYALSSFDKVDPPPVWVVFTEAAKHQ